MAVEGRRFRGFGPGARAVLRAIAEDNARETFLALKADYEREARGPAMDLVADLGAELAARGAPLGGDPRRALFRPNRDVRFSRDKSPYKTNVSFVLSRGGDKREPGVLYFQLGLEGAMAALGFYMPEPAVLSALRARILARPKAWRAVAEGLGDAGLELGRDGALVRLPRGVPADAPADLHDALRLKSFAVARPIPDAVAAGPGLVDALADFALAGLPLLEFGWRALEA